MKFATLAAVLFCVGCQSNPGAGSSQIQEENKKVILQLVEGINRHDPNIVDQCMAPSYVDHGTEQGIPPNREGLKKMFEMYFAAFPDVKGTVLHILAEGDLVAVHIQSVGTNKASIGGIPATGKVVTIDEFHIGRIVGGKIVEHWGLEDNLSMMKQLGVFGSK